VERYLLMVDGGQSAEVALLTEIRDLLLPVADHYREEYEERQAARRAAVVAKVREMIGTPKRRVAWALADGTLSQREISRRSTLAEGATSQLFKALRDLGAVEGDIPRRTMEV
jgi:hypothetical protein